MAMTRQSPLPQSLRAELEDAFGADLADVRVHESALAGPGMPRACAYGESVYFAPGGYDPSSSDGREVLAHEVAHVLQQRYGRVHGDAGPALEAEASTAGRAFAAGRPVAIPGRPGGQATPAIQCYAVGTPAALGLGVVNAAHTAPTHAQDSFISQLKGGANAASPSSFLQPGGGVNLDSSNPAGVTVRLSGNGNMAIQDANASQRQPKVFYATQTIVDEANDRLALLGSRFRLDTDPPGAAQRSITNGAATLLRVTPRNVANGTAGIAMDAPQSCNALFNAFVGNALAAQSPQPVFAHPLNPIAHQMIEFHIARELLAPVPATLDSSSAVNLANTMRAIAIPYGTAARGAAAGFVADLQLYGLNEYAAPEVGEGFVTCSLIAAPAGAGVALGGMPATYDDHYQLNGAGGPQVVQHARSWGAHYGGVVAKDGADVITLENYARTVEDALVGDDERYYFQMYDTNPPAGGARSWHHAWANTPMQPIAGGAAAPATHEPVSPGAKGFANPITFGVSIPDSRYNAIAATTHGAAVLNTIKNHHAMIAGVSAAAGAAASAHQQLLHVLKGLHYANTHLATNTAGDAARVNAWRAAVHAAYQPPNSFRSNLQALNHTYGRLMQMRT